jgi:hypothetical protein
MPKLHVKRMALCSLLFLWVGFQFGWNGREMVNSNPVSKFLVTGKF